ncbi:ankyrin-1-like [Zophobas morio]|uniref:ankyrin-1-like n=1 Tax=Zophobas morio TaxID=2755281 RepID=UPI00308280D0
MGKTELTKSFKNNCSSKYWTVMLSPQEINLFFKQSGRCQRSDYLNLFHTFILEEKYHHLKHLDKEFFKNCSEQLRVFYVWDAIDDILTKYLNAVSDLIVLLSNKGFTQWVTVRKHLKSCLEKQLNTLSLGINHFNENEQEDYIRKRLRSIISADNIESSIQKVKSSFAFIKHVDILGIPLQIFMLTEIVLQNNKKYLTLIGSSRLLTDLYHYFIQEKFNIFYESKRSLNIRDSSSKLLLKKDKKKTLIHYEKLAVKLVFSDCSDVNIHECINTSTYDYESIGIITDSQNNTPVFLHASFAEYLAAVYFLKNVKLIPGEKFFNRKYNSVRFFFDMLLAKKSPLHTAILYRNFDELMNYDDEILTRKDEGGRNALHLICSWGQRHRRLRVTSYKINRFLSYLTSVLLKNKSVLKRIPRVRYTLQNDESSEGELETREYLDGVLYLLNKCSISEPDAIFELTPLSYARVSESLGAELELLQSGMLDLQPEQLYDHCDRINILYYTSLFGYDKGIRMIATKELSTYYEEVNFICKFSEITPLAIASSNGHLAVVEYLLELGAGIDDIDKNGRTPLYTASENGHEKIVECLVECGVEIDLANKNGETPLYVAAEKGHEKTVKFLVQYGAEINRASKYGDTPLHAASSKGHEKIVEYLMQFGAEINRADDVGWTPLRAAYWNGHKNIVQCLMTRGAEINCADKRGETLLYVASSKGHNEIVECLVKCRAEVNGTDNYVRTPLYAAAKNGHENVVECLLECEAEINLADYKDRTPLHAASWNGHEKIVECLAKFGAEIDSPDYNGQTPLYAASSNGHKYIVEILLKLGAQINHADYKNRTPLYVASLNGHQKVVECLVKCGAEIKCANKPDRTALHAAAKSGHEKIVEYLVHSGAELDIGDHLGWTSLHLASKNGHEKVVECLVKFGAEINRLGFNGWTPLYAAALNGHETIVEYLMSHKADINRANKSGQTPLYAASSSGHLTIVEYLVINGAEISCGNDFLSTPLYAASSKGHEKIAEYLMKCEAKLI